jgi:diacylglycerol kinase family enzyme
MSGAAARRILLVVNPRASKVDEALVAQVEDALGGQVRTEHTTARGDATGIARELEGSVDAIAVFGGDGTYNEVLNGVSGVTPVGFVPGGGTSVLPRALGLPREPVAAAQRIAGGRTRRIGLGRANGRRFGFSCGIGVDAELVRRVDERGRREDGRRPGDRAFVAAALHTLSEHRRGFAPVLEVDGHGPAAFAFVANGAPYTYLGPLGLRVAPRARFEGGVDLVAPERLGAVGALAFAARAALGRLDRSAGVLHVHDADALTIRCRAPQPMQLDGEDVGDVELVEIAAERDAVDVLL